MKVFAKINAYTHITHFMNEYEDQDKLEGKVDPDTHKIKLAFGMHFGWAIEGALGSRMKIDPTYVSPHVNIAYRLCNATAVYGVNFLISGGLYDKLSPEFQDMMRIIDTIEVKGDIKLDVYTMKIEEDQMTEEDDPFHNLDPEDDEMIIEKKEVHAKMKNEYIIKNIVTGQMSPYEIFTNDGDIDLLRKNSNRRKTLQFNETFHEGFVAYKRGDWQTAIEKFNQVNQSDPTDGPTKTLYKYIESLKCSPPPSWDGWRGLDPRPLS